MVMRVMTGAVERRGAGCRFLLVWFGVVRERSGD